MTSYLYVEIVTYYDNSKKRETEGETDGERERERGSNMDGVSECYMEGASE